MKVQFNLTSPVKDLQANHSISTIKNQRPSEGVYKLLPSRQERFSREFKMICRSQYRDVHIGETDHLKVTEKISYLEGNEFLNTLPDQLIYGGGDDNESGPLSWIGNLLAQICNCFCECLGALLSEIFPEIAESRENLRKDREKTAALQQEQERSMNELRDRLAKEAEENEKRREIERQRIADLREKTRIEHEERLREIETQRKAQEEQLQKESEARKARIAEIKARNDAILQRREQQRKADSPST